MDKELIALIGDVGGTNMRLQLVVVDFHSVVTPKLIKKHYYDVASEDVFVDVIKNFLSDQQEHHPNVAAIGMAGPVFDNTVELSNVLKWGKLDGVELGKQLKIPHFRFLNDFEAASYGVLTIEQEQFVSVNGLPIRDDKMRGIIGPGTGLGNSTLYPVSIGYSTEIVVLPSEGGHTDFPNIDEETQAFKDFLLKVHEGHHSYISVERSFCGPTIPHMFSYMSQKYPDDPVGKENLSSKDIIARGVAAEKGSSPVLEGVVDLLLRIYASAMGNFMAQHVCVGGLYLIGSLTKSLAPKMKGVDLMKGFRERHPEIVSIIDKTPIAICNEVELGLRGAYWVARNIYQHHK